MTERLKAICGQIERTRSFIDVGCDHGYVTEYVLKHNLAGEIAACDISAASLDKAKKRLSGASGVKFICADGAAAARGYETVLISGLGGAEICAVIAACEPSVFILSPQSQVRDVRELLLMRDYDIVFDRVIKDGKFYDVIKAVRSGGKEKLQTLSSAELTHGVFARERCAALEEKLRGVYARLCRYPQSEENRRKLQETKEVLSWQSK